MAGVDIKYKGNSIATIQGSGSKTLRTQGKYCEGDILVDYTEEGITPSGTKNITTNGSHDVTQYESANVNVPVGVFPSGSENITANGTYDVTNKASAVVNVPTGSENSRCWKLSLAVDSSKAQKISVATSDWLKTVRSNQTLVVSLCRIGSAVTAGSVYVVSAVQSNAILSGSTYGNIARYNTAGNSLTLAGAVHAISDTSASYPTGFKISESGELSYYTRDGGASHVLPAGDYLITAAIGEV